MKISEAISRADLLKPNTYPRSEKIKWLSDLDGVIKRDVIDTHEGGEEISFSGYTDDTPEDTVLLVSAPYDEIYVLWIQVQIDFENKEFTEYNNMILRYNDLYSAFAKNHNRTHMPKSRKIKFF